MNDNYLKDATLQELMRVLQACNEEVNELKRGINYESGKDAPNYRLICQMANDALEQINLILTIKLEINSRGSDKSLGADDLNGNDSTAKE
jgi:hypothetical protein